MPTELDKLKSLQSAVSMSREMKKSERQRPRRFAFLKKTSILDLAIAWTAYFILDKIKA